MTNIFTFLSPRCGGNKNKGDNEMGKRNYKKKVILIMTGLLLSKIFFAEATELHVTGNLVETACTIENGGSYNIDLGEKIPSFRLNSSAPYSDWKNFNINLIDCPASIKLATVTFSGKPDSVQKEMYANSKGALYAANVAVELQQVPYGINVGNGKSLSMTVGYLGRSTFKLRARAHGSGHATPGRISAAVLMNLTYN
ncbi:fimbrial protein [Serratia sp. UGAL515B_01]|uniref:fimbrial protein n=1 Tax=Serratia sp. UGAL515B_01 TaxID=2986763 RepID=UPI0029555332|nr:fimbrial protein [Serratia sp. UGAL515B_01]WON76479.1 type 1 fimbrial protein [Serratia sp. UGAL515B_01]